MSQSKRNRRDVLRALGLAGGVALLGPLAARSGSAYAAMQSYTSVNLGLEIDGTVTPVESIEGGNAFADVALEPPIDGIFRKHLTAVRFEDLLVQVPLHAAQPLLGWIGSLLAPGGKSPPAKSGAIVYLDINGKEQKRLEFFNAVVSEVTLPACDAAARDPASLKLRLTPESTRLAGGSGAAKGFGAKSAAAKAVATNTFRMSIQGLESATQRISKVSAASAKRGAPLPPAGIREKPLPAALDCAPLSITIQERDAGPFFQWFTDFAVQGNANAERPGRLEFLAADMSAVVAAVDFGNLGILRYAPLSGPGERAGSMTQPLVQVDMFCETMNLTVT
jgi:hypothetical protein